MNASRTRILLRSTKRGSDHEFSAGVTEKLLGWEELHAKTAAWSYDMQGHGKNAWKDIANWPAKRLSN